MIKVVRWQSRMKNSIDNFSTYKRKGVLMGEKKTIYMRIVFESYFGIPKIHALTNPLCFPCTTLIQASSVLGITVSNIDCGTPGEKRTQHC